MVNALQEVSGLTWKKENFENLYFNVTNSEEATDPSTKSRYNLANAAVVLRFVEELSSKHVLMESTVIITPYQAQRAILIAGLYKLSSKMKISISELPQVRTVTYMQGKEAWHIIYDTVITKADRKSEMGLANDENLCNVAFTRGKIGTTLVASNKLLEGLVAQSASGLTSKTGALRQYKDNDA